MPRAELTATSTGAKRFGSSSIAKPAREVRSSPDTGDRGGKAGACGDGEGGGETEDPAEEGARASHPAGGIGEAKGMGRSGRTESGVFRPCRRGRAVWLLN